MGLGGTHFLAGAKIRQMDGEKNKLVPNRGDKKRKTKKNRDGMMK